MILIVEHDTADADLLVHMLDKYGKQALVVGTLDEALAPTLDSPEVVLLDLGLTGVGGVAAVTACLTRYPHVPVIVVTGFEDDTVYDAIAAGAVSYLVKNSLTGRDLNWLLQLASLRGEIVRLGMTVAALESRLKSDALKDKPTGS